MSCGFTNDTVVHHGRFAGAFAYHDWNCAAIFGSVLPALPRTAIRRRKGPAREPVGLQDVRVARRPAVVVAREMPLPEPRRRIPVLPQHRAPGRELRGQRAPARDQTPRLVAVQARQERTPRRRAVVRRREVIAERHAAACGSGRRSASGSRRPRRSAGPAARASDRPGPRGCSAPPQGPAEPSRRPRRRPPLSPQSCHRRRWRRRPSPRRGAYGE